MTNHFSTRICPSCGAPCYADMNRCYECLYEFDLDDSETHDAGDGELVAVGVVVVKKESAPKGALEITLKFDDAYARRLFKSFSDCS